MGNANTSEGNVDETASDEGNLFIERSKHDANIDYFFCFLPVVSKHAVLALKSSRMMKPQTRYCGVLTVKKIHRARVPSLFSTCLKAIDKSITSYTPSDFAKLSPELKQEILYRLIYRTRKMTNSLLFSLLDPSYTSLHLFSSTSVTDAVVACGVSQYCSNLELLDLTECDRITHESVLSLVRMTSLKRLFLYGTNITDASVKYIAKNLTQLLELDLSACSKVSEFGFQHLFTGNLTKLVSLSLEYSAIGDNSVSKGINLPELRSLSLLQSSMITSAGVRTILEACPLLEDLILSSCPITDEAFQVSDGLKNLQLLGLNGCLALTDTALELLAKRVSHLRALNLGYCLQMTDSGITQLVKKCKSLACISLNRCSNITDTTVRQLADSCPKLRQIELSYCNKVSSKAIKYLAQHCTNLQDVLLEHCSSIDDTAIVELSQRCPNITQLNLNGCFLLTDSSLHAMAHSLRNLDSLQMCVTVFQHISDSGLSALVSSCTKLRMLDIRGLVRITDDSAASIATCLSKLEEIGIGNSARITGAGIQKIADALFNLRALHLPGLRVTDVEMASIARKLPRLTTLDLTQCVQVGPGAVKEIGNNCHMLLELALTGTMPIDDEAINAIATGLPLLEHLFLPEAYKVSEDAFMNLLAGCPALSSLSVPAAEQITDRAMANFAYCSKINLLTLENSKITDDGLVTLVSHCNNLHNLSLADNANITDAGLRSCGPSLNLVQSLNLSGCKITDDGINAIAQHCPLLHSLSVAKCTQITDYGIQSILASCNGLDSLDLQECPKISDHFCDTCRTILQTFLA